MTPFAQRSRHPERIASSQGFGTGKSSSDRSASSTITRRLAHAGVEVFSSGGGKYLGDPALDPVFQELNRRKAVVFVHPPTARCCTGLVPGVADAVIETQTVTTRAIAGMVFSGAAQRFPELRRIFCHAGGTMPSVNERLVLLAKTPRYQSLLPAGFLAEAANADHAQALDASGVFTPAELAGIHRNNAVTLLRLRAIWRSMGTSSLRRRARRQGRSRTRSSASPPRGRARTSLRPSRG